MKNMEKLSNWVLAYLAGSIIYGYCFNEYEFWKFCITAILIILIIKSIVYEEE